MSKDEGKKLSCPKCLGFLESKEIGEMEGSPVCIDQCSLCQGIWLDKGELNKILTLKFSFDDEIRQEEFRKDWTNDAFDLKIADCPRCKNKMQRVKSREDRRVTIDYCVGCGGTWLDGGEIRLLMRGGPIERALEFVFRKLTAPLRELRETRGPLA